MAKMAFTSAAEFVRQTAVSDYGLSGWAAWKAPDRRLIDLAAQTHRILGGDHCSINILDGARQWSVTSPTQVPVSVSARTFSMCQRVLSRAAFDGDVFWTSDASAHGLLADNIWVNGDAASIRFYACAPLITPEGLTLGTACAWGERKCEVGDHERAALRAFRSSVMAVLQARRAELRPAQMDCAQTSGLRAGR